MDVYSHTNSGEEIYFQIYYDGKYRLDVTYKEFFGDSPILNIQQTIIFADDDIASSFGTEVEPMRMDILEGPRLPDESWIFDDSDFDYYNNINTELYVEGEAAFDPSVIDPENPPYVALAAFRVNDDVIVGFCDSPSVDDQNDRLIFEWELYNNSLSGDEIYFKLFVPDNEFGGPVFEIQQTLVFEDNSIQPDGYGSWEEPMQAHHCPKDGKSIRPIMPMMVK